VAYLIQLETFTDDRGSLTVIEKQIPFSIKRVFYLYDLGDKPRGLHKHYDLTEAVICLSGSFVMSIKNDKITKNFLLNSKRECLIIPPNDFRILHSFTKHCVILVLASCEYDKKDYIFQE